MQGQERTSREKETWQEPTSGILALGVILLWKWVSKAAGFQIQYIPKAQIQKALGTDWGPALCYGPEGKWSLLQGLYSLTEITNRNIEFHYELFIDAY